MALASLQQHPCGFSVSYNYPPYHKRLAPCSNGTPADYEPPRKRLRSSPESSPESERSPLSRYEKIRVLGDGTFGRVWAAREIATGKLFALKQIKMTGNEGFPRTAIREIRIMRKAQHENVLSVRDVVWAEGNSLDAYLVMDLYDYDLRRLLDKCHVRFTLAEVKYLLMQLIRGVKYLHDTSIIHRDLKTENLLVDMSGHLKICDYGLSRLYSDRKAYTPVVVTLWYRSPELLLGPVEYSTEVDIWSVGCIFAELVMGFVLFNGNNEVEQIDKVFQILGTPDEETWPGYSSLPGYKKFRKYSPGKLRTLFEKTGLSSHGFNLLKRLLTLDPAQRITSDQMIADNYFQEEPWPAISIDLIAKRDTSRSSQMQS
eukprot:TRINITY_DN4338_c0_g1_i1.p1 TRINITY_DN4338_c0_g1~~TRINITY_DN4338_c0_g1_i1.p1  ORF type:complete len:372 (-),score=31.02 TRINITY_DN4338_c0_g1_i1:809-1924(-)